MGIADFVKGKPELAKKVKKECKECGEEVPADKLDEDGLCPDCAE